MPVPADFPTSDVARLCLHHPTENAFNIQLQSTAHRLALIAQWSAIPRGARVLELGCGQGDCTAVLAELVGPEGHVTAVDPGDADYGSPFTLGQAQAHLSAGTLGPRITWVHADSLDFLSSKSEGAEKGKNPKELYDVAVLALCTWYFSDPTVLPTLFSALSTRARRVCVAEWGLRAADPAAQTHVLAALAQGALEARAENSESNIRTLVAPAGIVRAALTSGWTLASEDMLVPAEGTLDGRWEAAEVVGEEFVQRATELIKDERERAAVLALRDATLASFQVHNKGSMKSVKSMDVWCGEFVRA